METIEKRIAKLLDGLEYSQEFPKEAIQLAKDHNVLILHGYSDDIVAIDGVYTDETYPDDNGKIYLTKYGVAEYDDDKFDSFNEQKEFLEKYGCKQEGKAIDVMIDKEFYWQFKTDIPHETFNIYEDGEKYCKGIVFLTKHLI